MLLFTQGSRILIRRICSFCDVQCFDIPLFLLRLYLQNGLYNVLVILVRLCLKLDRFGHRSLWNDLLHAAVRSHLLLFLALFGILGRLWLFRFLLLIALDLPIIDFLILGVIQIFCLLILLIFIRFLLVLIFLTDILLLFILAFFDFESPINHLPIIDFLILGVIQIFCLLILLIFIRFLLVLIFLTDILLLFILAFLILNHQLISWLFDDLYHGLWFLCILLLLILHLIWHDYLASSALFLFLLLRALLVRVLGFMVILRRVPLTKSHFLLPGILDTLFFFLFRLLEAPRVRVQVSVATRILLR